MIAYFRTKNKDGKKQLQKTSDYPYDSVEDAINDVKLLVSEVGGVKIISPILCVINGGKL